MKSKFRGSTLSEAFEATTSDPCHLDPCGTHATHLQARSMDITHRMGFKILWSTCLHH